jgi:hypothetical protein
MFSGWLWLAVPYTCPSSSPKLLDCDTPPTALAWGFVISKVMSSDYMA